MIQKQIHVMVGIFFLLVICMFCSCVMADVMISSPNVVKPGEQMSVYIGNLNKGDDLQVDVIGDIKVNAGLPFTFQMNDFNTGISIDSPNLDLSMSGLMDDTYVTVNITHQDGANIEKIKKVSGGSWNQAINEAKFPKGNYRVIINGTAASNQIPLDFTFSGEADEREVLNELTMNIAGLSNGLFDISTQVNGDLAERKAFTVQDTFIALN